MVFNGRCIISPMFKPVYGMLGTTFGGNHLACAAALAVMDVIEQDRLIENAANIGAYLLEELKNSQIKEVREMRTYDWHGVRTAGKRNSQPSHP